MYLSFAIDIRVGNELVTRLTCRTGISSEKGRAWPSVQKTPGGRCSGNTSSDTWRVVVLGLPLSTTGRYRPMSRHGKPLGTLGGEVPFESQRWERRWSRPFQVGVTQIASPPPHVVISKITISNLLLVWLPYSYWLSVL